MRSVTDVDELLCISVKGRTREFLSGVKKGIIKMESGGLK
jgi:hypothetical protein